MSTPPALVRQNAKTLDCRHIGAHGLWGWVSRKGAKLAEKITGSTVALCAFAPLREMLRFVLSSGLKLNLRCVQNRHRPLNQSIRRQDGLTRRG